MGGGWRDGGGGFSSSWLASGFMRLARNSGLQGVAYWLSLKHNELVSHGNPMVPRGRASPCLWGYIIGRNLASLCYVLPARTSLVVVFSITLLGLRYVLCQRTAFPSGPLYSLLGMEVSSATSVSCRVSLQACCLACHCVCQARHILAR